MRKQRRFTKAFEGESVRIAATCGLPQRAMAEDLGIGRSTLVHWIGRIGDRLPEMPGDVLP